MRCKHCGKPTNQPKHHVIFKSQSGTDHPDNLIQLCLGCHYGIHHGSDSKLKAEVLQTCYDYIRPNLDNCWDALFKPKIVNLIEQGEL